MAGLSSIMALTIIISACFFVWVTDKELAGLGLRRSDYNKDY